MTTLVGRYFLICGRVQGVYYRRFAQQQATHLNITGWVRNIASGEVEVCAYGTEQQLTTFLERLWQGPPVAKVTTIDSKNIPYTKYEHFEVR